MALGVGMGAISLGSIFVAINANLTGLVSGTQLAKAKLGHFQRQVSTIYDSNVCKHATMA